jgi:hypothetical protein
LELVVIFFIQRHATTLELMLIDSLFQLEVVPFTNIDVEKLLCIFSNVCMTFLNLSQPFVSSVGNMKNIVIYFSLSILSKWFEGLSMLAIQDIIRIKSIV